MGTLVGGNADLPGTGLPCNGPVVILSRAPRKFYFPAELARHLCGFAGMLLAATTPAQTEVSEYALKAAFIYNFAKFVDWPKPADGLLHLCVAADEAFEGEFDRLSQKAAAGLRVQVDHPKAPEMGAQCQIVFIAESETDSLPGWVQLSREKGALTVSDAPGFLDRGIMIEMRMEDERVSFEVNMTAARAAKLDISSRLLRLAKRVY
jgi:hypothetical protein